MTSWLPFVMIGIAAGIASGLFGVDGGIVVVPALIYWAGFAQHMAMGTSLAVLVAPIGLAATIEYWMPGPSSGCHSACSPPALTTISCMARASAWAGSRPVACLLREDG